MFVLHTLHLGVLEPDTGIFSSYLAMSLTWQTAWTRLTMWSVQLIVWKEEQSLWHVIC